jgi:hypothetical protein
MDIIENCSTCDQVTGDCISCNSNYILSGGECIPYEGCLYLDHTNTCMICANGYFMES